MSTSPGSVVSKRYPLESYERLLAYAAHKLYGDLVGEEYGNKHPRLVHDLFAPIISAEALFQRFDKLAWELDEAGEDAFPQRLAGAPAFLRDGIGALGESEVSQSFIQWRAENAPAINQLAYQRYQDLQFVRRQRMVDGVTEYTTMQIGNFLDTLYDGITILAMLPLMTDYPAYIMERQLEHEKWEQYTTNLWLWHAHAVGAALWGLHIATPALDTLLDDVLDRHLPPDFNLLA